jgi:DNA-binding MarR family transcriptional regulator
MLPRTIATIRAFNRYYTAVIGLLDKNYLESGYSLTEARILFELNAHPQGITAKDLIATLKVDKGYLSRLIQVLVKSGLVDKRQAVSDKRAFRLMLSKKGTAVFNTLDSRSEAQIKQLLSALTREEGHELARHMEAIEQLLQKQIIR